jgi:hypothetical protein
MLAAVKLDRDALLLAEQIDFHSSPSVKGNGKRGVEGSVGVSPAKGRRRGRAAPTAHRRASAADRAVRDRRTSRRS